MIYNCDELRFRIIHVGFFNHSAGVFSIAPRPYAALSYRIEGTCEFEIEGKSFISSPGTVLFIPANTPYRANYPGGKSAVIHLSDCNYREAEVIPAAGNSVLLKFEELIRFRESGNGENGCKSIFYSILQSLYEKSLTSSEDKAFEGCISFINENFENPGLGIGEICRGSFVSESGLRRYFHRTFGISPKQYILKLRLEKALSMLSEGTGTVKEIAFSCGFSDEKYFSRMVKKRYGYPPSAFL